ncbi:PREDICTED: uncharacterized protein LOC109486216 [Branchiostoma belcheri]|uniref:Uncharacterized protein LOC109486216 n=1 Tax=Branchiostoma belcheri TaxID=7741 RepID=A0A6P5AGN9_BRABE|nr:PREDICTED: uncharacterized protein LOC109486216 [Branchiostoma belcheri]
MLSLTVLLLAVTVASAAVSTTRPTSTFRPTTTHFVPGCESTCCTWPNQHTLGETWHEQFEGFCQDCVCLATGKQCEPCPPRGCFRPVDILQYYGEMSAGETAIIELSPGNCVLCDCQDYWAHCNSYPCDGVIA